MNLNPECTTPLDEQLFDALAYAINCRDTHDMTAHRYAEAARHGGEQCDCADPDWDEDDDPDHECADLLNAEQCLAQAQISMGLAQAAATAALAAATVIASRKS